MFKLYQKSQAAQLNWIRNHPVQWVTLNVIIAVGIVGYYEYKARRDAREFENEIAQQEK